MVHNVGAVVDLCDADEDSLGPPPAVHSAILDGGGGVEGLPSVPHQGHLPQPYNSPTIVTAGYYEKGQYRGLGLGEGLERLRRGLILW